MPAGGLRDVVGIAAAPAKCGYWLATEESRAGGVLGYGAARFHGATAVSAPAARADRRLRRDALGAGVLTGSTTASGSVRAFGALQPLGPTGGLPAGRRSAGSPRPATGAATGSCAAVPSNALPPPAAGFVPGHVTAIGDSVMLDVAPALEAAIPGVDVEAAVSRQWDEGVALARELEAEHRLGAIVVIDLGTNGPITWQQFMNMMSALAGASRVVFVFHLPSSYSWSTSVNATLRAGVARYPRAQLADFNALADQHPGGSAPTSTCRSAAPARRPWRRS